MTFTPPPSFTTRPTLQGNFGMSASTHWLATASAQAVLERGGNAFDAAVAAGFVLQIVEPHMGGPAGEMTAIIATADNPVPQVLMGQGPAPAGASIEHFTAEGLDIVPGSGALAAPVPGQFDAWLLLLRDYGTWELPDVLQFAIHYARHGHPIVGKVSDAISTVEKLFAEHWRTSYDAWIPGGRVPQRGDVITNCAYADTLERLCQAGSRSGSREQRIDAARSMWKEGFVAEAIEKFARTPHWHSDGLEHAGVITAADLAGFSAHFEPAVTGEFRGHTIAKVGPWTQGPALLQALAILDGFDDEHLDPSTAVGAHTIMEAVKLAFADREAYFGDHEVPLDHLLSPDYIDERRSLITDCASTEFRPGSIPGHDPFIPPLRTEDESPTATGAGSPTILVTGETRGDTCHLDVVDRWGNMISATPSGGWLQSSPHIPELGFALSTRLQMNWMDPESPSALRPGKRPRITLTPTLVLRDGVPVTAVGTPGGDGQDQWQLLYLLRTIVGGYDPQQAIDAPAFNTTSFPSSFWPRAWTPAGADVEDRIGDKVIAELERRGHVATRVGNWALGRISAVTRDPSTGLLSAAANARYVQGYAAGR